MSPYPKTKREYQYCDSCGTLLPAPGFYCIQCNPPEHPEPDPEKGMGFSQACLRIFLLVLVFVVVAVFKLGIDSTVLFQKMDEQEVPLKVAKDEDYKMVFKVNVSFANLRNEPNTKTSTILFVLTQGTEVEVLEKKGKWSKIRSKSNQKEKSRTGWLVNRLLDSEIK
ncbi:MAG: SH3 domain-containing protein [Nitrospina sp.]|nr:SH3 domain-containing protein [Nitrospina sp.]